MAFTTSVLLGAALVGGGIAEGINALSFGSKNKGPEQVALPDENKAKADASATVADQRRTLLASGGQTDYTGGTGILTGSDTTKTTLLGG